jgi:GNAT superfamily N-acetyltransferase
MYDAIAISGSAQLERFCDVPHPTRLTPETITRQTPDALRLMADHAGRGVARCSLWWTQTPCYLHYRVGLVGHYAATEPAAAAELLHLACRQLAAAGCTLAIGPMDGNTWQRYRLLTERGSEPVFFLEPDNPDDWPAHFTDNGFTPLAQYYSALNTNLEQEDPRMREVGRRLEAEGVLFRCLRVEQFEDELRNIYALSLASFRENFLYTPIDEEGFVAQYQGIQPYIRPELVLLAEKAGQPIGYLFAIPDVLEAKRGGRINTVILKTMAVHPEHSGAGLGGLLLARVQQAARECGYTRAIHALMHESNKSRKISKHTAQVMRRYTLFARPLEIRA